MARFPPKHTSFFIFLIFFSHHMIHVKSEKLTQLHFYWHDILSGTNPTAIRILPPATNTSTTMFGSMTMIDDALTLGPTPDSKLIGRAQGMYGFSSQTEFSALMVMNFAFLEGEYNGSTLSILGRNQVTADMREMPVVGGTGVFRFAKGYAQAHTQTIDGASGDAVVEYNVFVLHDSNSTVLPGRNSTVLPGTNSTVLHSRSSTVEVSLVITILNLVGLVAILYI